VGDIYINKGKCTLTPLHLGPVISMTTPVTVRMLFIDYSSAFNTIVASKLINKLRTLGLNTSLCNSILDCLNLPMTQQLLA
jgi:hypothetical protein